MGEIVHGNVGAVRFMLELGIDPNGNVHQIEELGGVACERCAEALPAWRSWTFYDLAKVMATGSEPSSYHPQIEILMKEYGGISSKVLPSRRGLYQRLVYGDSCHLCGYFDDSVRAERFTDEDERFNAAERAERVEAQRRMRAKAERRAIRFAELRWSGAQRQ